MLLEELNLFQSVDTHLKWETKIKLVELLPLKVCPFPLTADGGHKRCMDTFPWFG